MGRSNRNQTFERARWHQVDCDYGCRASRLESATALRNSASFRDYGPANGGQRTFDKDIQPLFRPIDIEHMKDYNVSLDDYAYMSDSSNNYRNAHDVLETLSTKRMPPGGPF